METLKEMEESQGFELTLKTYRSVITKTKFSPRSISLDFNDKVFILHGKAIETRFLLDSFMTLPYNFLPLTLHSCLKHNLFSQDLFYLLKHIYTKLLEI